MVADLFNLLFNQAVCLAFVPEAARSTFCIIGQGMQKNLIELLITTMPHGGGFPSAFTEGKSEGAQQIDELSEHWESRNPNLTQTTFSRTASCSQP